MARLRTTGFEIGIPVTTVDDEVLDGRDTLSGATAVLDTATFRSGLSSAKCAGTSVDASGVAIPFAGVLARTYFFRAYIRLSALSTLGVVMIMVLQNSTGNAFTARLKSTGKLALYGASTQIGSDSVTTLAINTWYRLELSCRFESAADDSAELRLDGVTVASGTFALSTTAPAFADVGWVEQPGVTSNMFVDDVALNDDQGADQNSWPGAGSIYLCKPISDNQRGSWTGGAGGTTNLWDAVNNIPPIGTATETDLTQIENVDTSPDNATDEYRINLTTYDNAGIPAGDTIKVLHILVNHGEDVSTGAKTGRAYHQANPAGTVPGTTFTYGAAAGGALLTWPVKWRTEWASQSGIEGPLYNPSVTRSSSPVLALRKVDTGSRVASVDFIGMYVETLPAVVPVIPRPPVIVPPVGVRESVF